MGKRKKRVSNDKVSHIPKPRLKDYRGKLIERVSAKGKKTSKQQRKEFKAKVKKMVFDY